MLKCINLENNQMNKKLDFKDNEKYSCDSVINQGYAIYDEWTAKKLSSRKIVDSVNDAVSAVEKRKTITARLIALSYLFALDTRVKERYNTILRCIIFYFSWKELQTYPKRAALPQALQIAATKISIHA